jgi:SpoVK/Ycf46/Vps4 family AAA+-type ATPase
MQGYSSSRAHIYDEMQRLDALLHLYISRQRCDPARADFNEFRGLFLSEDEIDRLIVTTPPHPVGERTPEDNIVSALAPLITQLDHQIARKTAMAQQQGVHLALPRLVQLFQLTPFDIDTLLLCLAPELDLKYEKLYAYLQNDVTRKKPSLDLALHLLCTSFDEKLQARSRLLAEAPLQLEHLVAYADDGVHESLSSLARPLRLDARILHYLLEMETMDEHLTAFTTAVMPRASLDTLLLPADFTARLVRLFHAQCTAQNAKGQPGPLWFCFQGPAGVGKTYTAEALCHARGLNLLIADVAQMVAHGALEPMHVSRLCREARLRTAAVYFDHADVLLGSDDKTARVRSVFLRLIGAFPGIVFIDTVRPWESSSHAYDIASFHVVFPKPDYALRKQSWETFLFNGNGHAIASDEQLDHLVDTFDFTVGKIRQAVADAHRLAVIRDPDTPEIATSDLYQACYTQSHTRLTTMARKVTPLYTWDDIVLPRNCLEQLQEICAQARYRQQVFEHWGFKRKVALGKGLSVLFVGPSGTGKTMAADIIANDLGLELYKIDLSGVVSKYIGETEKNLSQIFEAAEQSNAALFFDEADAIFGKRSDIKDAHDRYANIETNYLLQRMEEYEGIVILASNFPKNIDDAFTRRLRFIVEFPLPDESSRLQIWQHIFPADMPRSNDLDIDFLSRKLKLSGGHIKNIALNAAFLAAANSGVMDMEDIIRATKREFHKMGRLCVRADFEQYFEWVREE